MSYSDPVVDKIIQARVSLLFKHPFFGNLATRMKLVESSDWLPTAATDFKNFFYNKDFLEKMSVEQVAFVLGHEILHVIFNHLGRREYRDHQLYNIAADYVVNGILKKERIGEDPPIKFFYDPKYDGMSSEEVYDILYENAEKIDIGALGQLLDQHLDPDQTGNPGKSTYTDAEVKEIQDAVKEAMLQSAMVVGAGNLPGQIKRLIGDLTEPKINWRELIRQQIQSLIKADFTFTRPSRKGWSTGVILPGSNYDQMVDLCISLDMSGSIGSKEINEFLGEVKSIMDEFRQFNIRIWSFDTQVYNDQSYDTYTADDLLSYEPEGGGGTSIKCNWEYMKDNDIVPKKFLVFTDGYNYDNDWGDPEYTDTVFVIFGNETQVPPFGTYAYYDAVN